MNIIPNPIQYQLQLFGANGAQIGVSINSAKSDPFGMAISAIGATVVPEVKDAGSGSNGGGAAGDTAYRSWAKSLQDYTRAAQGGTQAPADSGSEGAKTVAPDAPTADTTADTAPDAAAADSGGSSTDDGAGSAEAAAPSTAAPTDNGSTSATSAAQNSYGGLLGLFRR